MKFSGGYMLPLVANFILIWVIQVVNDGLAMFSLQLFMPALWVVFPVFHMPLKTGFFISVLTGLWWDATFPVPFGSLGVLMGVAYVLMVSFKTRYELKKPFHMHVLVQVMNACLFLGYACILMFSPDIAYTALSAFFVSFLLSQLTLGVVLFWYIDFQKALFFIFRCKPVRDR